MRLYICDLCWNWDLCQCTGQCSGSSACFPVTKFHPESFAMWYSLLFIPASTAQRPPPQRYHDHDMDSPSAPLSSYWQLSSQRGLQQAAYSFTYYDATEQEAFSPGSLFVACFSQCLPGSEQYRQGLQLEPLSCLRGTSRRLECRKWDYLSLC